MADCLTEFLVDVLPLACECLMRIDAYRRVKSFILGMKKVSVSLRPDQIDLLADRPEESRSEALRAILDEYEELRTECEELHTRCERLENEKRTLLERNAEQRRREAGLLERARWWAFGMPTEEE
jgi:predicted nuclease with TOPRIM domain